jgi:hypothetical protein
MTSILLSILKIFSTFSTAIFGFFAIGTITRDSNGLTKYGKIAVLGLLVSLFISSLSQYFEYLSALNAQKKEASRLEKIIKAGYYNAFTTKEARYVLRYSLDHSLIKGVDKKFSNYLDKLLNQRGVGCNETHSSPFSEYDCDGFVYTHDPLDAGEIHFKGNSKILNFEGEGRAVKFLFSSMGISLAIKDRALFWEDSINFLLSGLSEDVKYSYNGQRLRVEVNNRDLPPDYLAKNNLSSIVDFAGKVLVLKTTSFVTSCSKSKIIDFDQCQKIYEIAEQAHLITFILKFPHRRNITYGSSRVYNNLKFTKSVNNKNKIVYTYTYPSDAAEFVVFEGTWFEN